MLLVAESDPLALVCIPWAHSEIYGLFQATRALAGDLRPRLQEGITHSAPQSNRLPSKAGKLQRKVFKSLLKKQLNDTSRHFKSTHIHPNFTRSNFVREKLPPFSQQSRSASTQHPTYPQVSCTHVF